jgi:acetyl-CoA carboxylase carboxyltransferase component
VLKLASEMVIDVVVPGDRLRGEITARLERSANKLQPRAQKKHSVLPV